MSIVTPTTFYEVTEPLSPFMWGAPTREIVPPGLTHGTVADVIAQEEELNLRLDQLAQMMTGPYFHPISEAMEKHPVHTRALSKHQFDVLRYGLVLDNAKGLVLVEVPRVCGDSGVKVAKEYAALFGEDMNDTEASQHPIHEEYVLAVYRVESEGEEYHPHGTPIFRLLFRNESHTEAADLSMARHFPMYYLRGVYIHHEKFYKLQSTIEMQRRTHANPENTAGIPTTDTYLLDLLRSPELEELCDAWLQVLEGIAPTRLTTCSVSTEISSLFLSSTLPEKKSEKLMAPIARHKQLGNRVRSAYYSSEKRMADRIAVVSKSRELIDSWRDGKLDITAFSTDLQSAEPVRKLCKCARILLRETRSGRNFIDHNEIVSFLPQDSDCERLQTYATLPAERLRRWVLKGLLTAELHGIHAIMLEMDTSLILGQCVGLLCGSETNRDHEALFHVCKIVVETVEDYLQHSGVVWNAVIVVADQDRHAVDVVQLCRQVLECIQIAKKRVEIEEIMAPRTPEEAQRDVLVLPSSLLFSRKAPSIGELDHNGSNAAVLLTTHGPAASTQAGGSQQRTVCEAFLDKAATARVKLSDEEMYALFAYCDIHGNRQIPIKDLIRFMLCLENPIDCKRKPYYNPRLTDKEAVARRDQLLAFHPVSKLDGCGLPFTEESMGDFLMAFCRSSRDDPEPSLNFIEFSMMVLALAKR